MKHTHRSLWLCLLLLFGICLLIGCDRDIFDPLVTDTTPLPTTGTEPSFSTDVTTQPQTDIPSPTEPPVESTETPTEPAETTGSNETPSEPEATTASTETPTEPTDTRPEDPPHIHDEVVDPAVVPDCTNTGLTEGKHCSLCGAVTVPQTTVAATGHSETTIPGKVATCTEDGLSDGKQCTICGTETVKQTVIAATGHSETTIPGKAATCTEDGLTDRKHCAVCGTVTVQQIVIAATGHSEALIPGKAATCTEDGLTDGKQCTTCGLVTVEQAVLVAGGHTIEILSLREPTWTESGAIGEQRCAVCHLTMSTSQVLPAFENLNGRYGYDYIGTIQKGAAYQTLYERMDAVATAFHLDENRQIGSDLIVGSFDYADLGLTRDEAVAVWVCYKADHPMFYWISGTVSFNNRSLYLLTTEEYVSGAVRVACHNTVYDAVLELYMTETSAYRLALAFHDIIIEGMDYAYESDGVTPQDDMWAHNILGFFEKQSGVCESYARAYQLLLNYHGVENVFVSGLGNGGGHAWNLVKLDNDGWYWFDLTWDDTPGFKWGISYDYFCATDASFDGHAPYSPNNSGINFQYALPARAQADYVTDDTIGASFSTNGYSGIIVGGDRVELHTVPGSGDVVIPDTLTFGGRTYTVVSLGGEALTCILPTGTTTVTIPKTVRFIWDNALGAPDLTSISVAEDNPAFRSVDGVLFTKSLYTLIRYPVANTRVSYVIPDETVEVAVDAFNTPRYLESIVCGMGVQAFGKSNNKGWGYTDPITGHTAMMTYNGELPAIFRSLQGDRRIVFTAANPLLTSQGGAIIAGGTTVMAPSEDVTVLVIPEGVTVIDVHAFLNFTCLAQITLPSTLTTIKQYGLSSYSIDHIYYNGTQAQWNRITKEGIWGPNDPFTVHFSDGTSRTFYP